MDAIAVLLLVIALQLVLAGVGWWLAGVQLGLSRAAAVHWGAYCGLTLLAALPGVFGAVARQPLWLAWTNLCIIVGGWALLRGVAIFMQRPRSARYDGLIVAFVALFSLWDLAVGLPGPLRSAMASAAFATLFAWGAVRNFRPVAAEFGRGRAGLLCGPMLAVALLYGWRLLRTIGWVGSEGYTPLMSPTLPNIVVLLLLTALVALFNLTLAYLVVTRLVWRLDHLSRHDALTGLLNRRALMDALQAEVGRLRRGGPGWALLLLDVDHFKRVNDQHGHAAGDAVLCRVGAVLRRSARDVDIVARTGGEEFCVLAPLTDLHGAALLAERLRQAVAEGTAGPSAGPGTVAVTVSIGVALSPSGPALAAETAEAALARADVALYRAKAGGRNRVELALDDGPPAPAPAAAVPAPG